MTQEEKDLLLKDLSTRLPHKVKINCFDVPRTLESISIDYDGFVTIDCGGEHFYHPLSNILHKDCLPYLRPMSSMTEEEKNEIKALGAEFSPIGSIRFRIEEDENDGFEYGYQWLDILDFLNEHHFDYRGLIEKGLALEAPEGMYNQK